jgi:hypothetical protein
VLSDKKTLKIIAEMDFKYPMLSGSEGLQDLRNNPVEA